jgi:hypothetical protein
MASNITQEGRRDAGYQVFLAEYSFAQEILTWRQVKISGDVYHDMLGSRANRARQVFSAALQSPSLFLFSWLNKDDRSDLQSFAVGCNTAKSFDQF